MDDKVETFLEERFPIFAISEMSRREKSVRQGHISTLQTWWARRPLSLCRAMIFLASLPRSDRFKDQDKVDELLKSHSISGKSFADRIENFSIELARFENSDNQENLFLAKEIMGIERTSLSMADSFSGGGSIPLEGIRLGAKVYASDLSPIAGIGLKLALNLIPLVDQSCFNKLKEDVEHIQDSISALANEGAEDDLAYFWSRTFRCNDCGRHSPTFSDRWLKKKGEKVLLDHTIVGDDIRYCLQQGTDAEKASETAIRNVHKKGATCLFCGSETSSSELMEQGKRGVLGEIKVARYSSSASGKYYEALQEVLDNPKGQGLSKRLSELLDLPLDKVGVRHLWAIQYGVNTVKDLFNESQIKWNGQVSEILINYKQELRDTSKSDEEFQFRLLSLVLIFTKTLIYSNRHSWWQSNGSFPASIFVRQAIPMIWSYVEVPPYSTGAGGWHSSSKWVLKAIEHLLPISNNADVSISDAACLEIESNSLDLVAIDPPYYDSITYAYLSDFFYPWMRFLLEDEFPSWFSDEKPSRSEELIVDRPHKSQKTVKDQSFFTSKMHDCLEEATRVLKPNGLLTIMFGHQNPDAWTSLFAAIDEAGLIATRSWPVHSERRAKFDHRTVNALETSCLICLRKSPSSPPERSSLSAFDTNDVESLIIDSINSIPITIPDPNDRLMAVLPVVLGEISKRHYLAGDLSTLNNKFKIIFKLVKERIQAEPR